MKKLDMVVGKRYKGYGYKNEYGEFFFTPQQVGAHEGQVKLVTHGDDFTVKTSRNWIIFNFKLSRSRSVRELLTGLTRMTDQFIRVIMNYEF